MKKYEKPCIYGESFTVNEHIAFCGKLDGSDEWLVAVPGTLVTHEAWNRSEGPVGGQPLDQYVFSNMHLVYEGSFYRPGDEENVFMPDSTHMGHQDGPREAGDMDWPWRELKCARRDNGQAWGYHYHFTEISNMS